MIGGTAQATGAIRMASTSARHLGSLFSTAQRQRHDGVEAHALALVAH
jgi:hypothetical protein